MLKGIYKIINCINNKIYIGQSGNIEKRFKEHKNSVNKKINIPLYRAIRKYGLNNFEFIIIEEVISVQNLDSREQFWLDHYQSYLPEKGYNIYKTASSPRGHTFSKEARKRNSDAHKGQIPWIKGKKHTEEAIEKMIQNRKGKSSPLKGRKLSEEHVLKLIESHKGQAVSEETRKKISLSSKNRKHSKGTIEKLSLISKNLWSTDEYKNKTNARRNKWLLNKKLKIED